MVNVLLCWEMVPVDVDFYLIPVEEESKELETLLACHGKLINEVGWEDSEESLSELNDRLCDVLEYCENKEVGTSWAKYKLDTSSPVSLSKVDVLVKSGFIL